ncbi:S8 family serine peptidase [Microbispora hainanensis]|uniref:S8 family serine peptidase n=1 Tax=Microbispora hainanensis TaxID=568844 RepID=UPI003CC73478
MFVVCSGNYGPGTSTISSIGVAESALTVGAVDLTDTVAGFSSRGPAGAQGLKPDMTGPGVDINHRGRARRWLRHDERVLDGHPARRRDGRARQAAPPRVGRAAAEGRPDGHGHGRRRAQPLRVRHRTGHPTTTVRVHYDPGAGNRIAIRGDAPLSWTTGHDCVSRAAGLWECGAVVPVGQQFFYKVLVNDGLWSTGSNYYGVGGQTYDIYPVF